MGCCVGANCIEFYSSSCVLWDGDDITCLGITKGDTLTTVENIIATKVCELAAQLDISTLTPCGEFINMLYVAPGGTAKTILDVLQVLMNYGCSLRTLIADMQSQLDSITNITVDFKCLKGVPAPCACPPCSPTAGYTIKDILQILIDAICDLYTKLADLKTSLLSILPDMIGNQVADMMQTCQTGRIVITGSGASTIINFRGFVPPGACMPYFGPLGYFDASGLGLPSTPVCGWAIANGLNGTTDMRGFLPVGAVQGMGGGGLNPRVDPSVNGVADSNYAVNDIVGEVKHLLTASECSTPAHTHTLNDPGHSHRIAYTGGDSDEDESGTSPNYVKFDGTDLVSPLDGEPDSGSIRWRVRNNDTGITVNPAASVSASTPHENRPPLRACCWIQMIA